MNVSTYIRLLGQQLCDTDGNALSSDVLTQYMAQAVTEYSRWRALLRTFGLGGLAEDAQSGSTSITTVGGPYSAGQTITLDAFTQFAETAVIDSISQIPPASMPMYVGTPVLLNLTAPTASTHYAGGLVAPTNPSNPASSTGGLNIVSGQQQYSMPLDFLGPEDDSWNIATGQRSALKQYQTFYDSVYEYSTLIQGVDIGQSQNFLGGPFGGIVNYGGYPGVPAQSDGSLALPFGQVASYSFTGSGQVVLNVLPTPSANYTLNFGYYALQQPETVPPSDMDALVAYGVYLGVAGNAIIRSVAPDLRDIRQDEKWSAAAANSRTLSKQYLDKFDTAIRLRPLASAG